ncbi:MAG: hypothetical protein KatS3mg043_0732 [Rhodothermaceae bacterium]|nr:MAG: hypothetical protein KatS3mg043_0732 [Rhodothermaceae bacterium]
MTGPAPPVPGPPVPSGEEVLAALAEHLRSRSRTRLFPRAFFVARSGVLTLAFSGFPASILALKRDLERAFPDLYPEEPGSRWPKVTLAARHQDRLLTPDHVDVLYRLCRPWNARLEQEAIAPLPVEVLSVVAYDCRSLERRRQTYRFPLEGGVPDPGDVPPPEHRSVRRARPRPVHAGTPGTVPPGLAHRNL